MRAHYIWRLVPDRMRRAKVKLGSIITAAVSHDGIVITRCTGKGVQAGGSGFVWRIGFAQLDSAILDRKSTRLNSSHSSISYAVFCLKKKNINNSPIYMKKTMKENLQN